MNTLHFKYAVEVEKTGSISQAAENLFMAQPNLSKAIRELEDTLQISIFRRTSKGMVPTPQGSEFLKYAKRILIQLEKMESIYSASRDDLQHLRISIPRGSYIAQAFVNFSAQLKMDREIDLRLQETNSIQAVRNLEENNYDLAVIRFQMIYEKYFMDFLREKEMEAEPVWEYEQLALMPRAHPLAQAASVSYRELARDSLEIVHGDISVPYLPEQEIRPPQEGLDYEKKRIYVYERASQFWILKQIPRSFMMVSPIPLELVKLYDLIQRRCHMADNRWRDMLVYQKGRTLTPLERQFLNCLYEAKNEVAFYHYE